MFTTNKRLLQTNIRALLLRSVESWVGVQTTMVYVLIADRRACQRFRKFRSEFKWKGSFRFHLPGIFGITSGGGPNISVGILRPKFTVLANRFFALIREFGKIIENDNSHFYWLVRFNRKMSFHFPQVFPLISDRSVCDHDRRSVFPYDRRRSQNILWSAIRDQRSSAMTRKPAFEELYNLQKKITNSKDCIMMKGLIVNTRFTPEEILPDSWWIRKV